MDMRLIKSVFAGNLVTGATLLKSAASPHARQVATMPTDHVPPANTGGTPPADNAQLLSQKKAISETLKNPGSTTGRSTVTETSRNPQTNGKGRKRAQNSETPSGTTHPAKSLLVQGVVTRPAALDGAASVEALNRFQRQVETRTPGEPVRLIADSRSPQAPALIARPAKPIAPGPDPIVSATSEPDNKLIRPPIGQGQIDSETILPGSPDHSSNANVPSGRDKDIGKLLVSGKTAIAGEKLANQESGKELSNEVPPSDGKTLTAGKRLSAADEPSANERPKTLEANKTAVASKATTDRASNQEVTSEGIAGNSRIALAGEKPVVTDEPTVLPSAETTVSTEPVVISTLVSNQQNQHSGREPIRKTPNTGGKTAIQSEQSAVRNNLSAPDSSKTQLSNTPSVAASEQPGRSQQKVLIAQQSPIPTSERTTPHKADAGQKDHRGKTELFHLPEKNGVRLENLSVRSVAQKISRHQVQLSATKAENSNNVLTHQGHKPDIEPGEQVLPGENVQPGATEQSPASPASAAFAKIAGNGESGDSVGGQIQESIHRSFRSGSQQIVVRLNPPELGRVAIKFAEQGDDISGLLQVDKPQTRDQIQQALPEIIQNLQDSGIAVKRLEVVLTNQQEQQTSRDQSTEAGQDSFSGQQGSPNPESQRSNGTYDQWLVNNDYVIEHGEPQMQFTDNAINMLV